MTMLDTTQTPRVEPDGWLASVDRRPSPDHGGAISPRFVVVHYTGSGSAAGSVDWLSRADEVCVSAHVVVGRDGDVTQLLPFTTRAYHAGKSAWRDVIGLNSCGVGVELVNWGPLTRDGQALRSSTGRVVDRADASYLLHRAHTEHRWWQRYTQQQLDAAALVVASVASTYQIEEVVGHDDVSPGRKIDPGPAFPWGAFLARVSSLTQKNFTRANA